jgi:small subunit ribosomal protein S4e
MARGPKKHLKRLNAPKHWMLDKLGGIWAPRPSQGPHKLRECMPLSIILRNRLKYALTRRETIMIVMRRLVQVDHKVRTDLNYPAGFMDVISMPKTNENFRLLYDTKGRFVLHSLKKSPKEVNIKLCKVKRNGVAKKASIGVNPFKTGRAGSVPYLITTDGRTIRYPDPDIKRNDTIKYNMVTKQIEGHVKMEIGNLCCTIRGKNVGRIGIISAIEKHPGAFDVVHITEKLSKGREPHTFTTRLQNIFVIGKGTSSWVSLPRSNGIRLDVFEEQEIRMKKKRN